MLGILVSLLGSQAGGNTLDNVLKNIQQTSDPFAQQRPFYQDKAQQLNTNPSSFFQDPAIASAMNFGLTSSGNKLASSGYNMSGNMGTELTRVGQNEAFKNYLPYNEQMLKAAGAFTPPQNTSVAQSDLGKALAMNKGAQATGVGAAIKPLSNILQGLV